MLIPKGGMKRKMNTRNKKALSPVVASIILIAVTVAVSIAVAAWMGALSFSFMGTEQAKITSLDWDGTLSSFTMTVANSGTKDLTITQIQINYATVSNVAGLTYTLKTGLNQTFVVPFTTYVNGTAYDVSVVTSSGYKFTDNFVGGQNKV